VILGPVISEHSINSIVIDYNRPVAIVEEPLVPCFPEIGDMLAIQGEALNDIWFCHAVAVNDRAKQATANFFVENSRWPGVTYMYVSLAVIVPVKLCIGKISCQFKGDNGFLAVPGSYCSK
jgi:hypothetical protein